MYVQTSRGKAEWLNTSKAQWITQPFNIRLECHSWSCNSCWTGFKKNARRRLRGLEKGFVRGVIPRDKCCKPAGRDSGIAPNPKCNNLLCSWHHYSPWWRPVTTQASRQLPTSIRSQEGLWMKTRVFGRGLIRKYTFTWSKKESCPLLNRNSQWLENIEWHLDAFLLHPPPPIPPHNTTSTIEPQPFRALVKLFSSLSAIQCDESNIMSSHLYVGLCIYISIGMDIT